jgi:hypothetical protein
VRTGQREEISEEITASLHEEKHEMDGASKSKNKIHVRKACFLEEFSKTQQCKDVQESFSDDSHSKPFEFAGMKK